MFAFVVPRSAMPVLTTLPVQPWTTCTASTSRSGGQATGGLRPRPQNLTFDNFGVRTLPARRRRPTGRAQPDPLIGTTSDQKIYTPFVMIFTSFVLTFATTGRFSSTYGTGSQTAL